MTSTRTPRRLGVIVPSTNTVVESDYARETPEDVTVHVSRMYLEETTADDERRMVTEYLPDAARDLATCRPDAVVFACTSAGAVLGEAGERNLVADLSSRFGAPVVSTNDAVARALTHRGIARAAVVTPYVPDLTERIVAGLGRHDVTAPQAYGMEIVDPFAIADVTPASIVEFVTRHVRLDGIDGLFVSCTNLRAMEAREALAEWSGLPVVTSNQAALEQAMTELDTEALGRTA